MHDARLSKRVVKCRMDVRQIRHTFRTAINQLNRDLNDTRPSSRQEGQGKELGE